MMNSLRFGDCEVKILNIHPSGDSLRTEYDNREVKKSSDFLKYQKIKKVYINTYIIYRVYRVI